jgi:hypothetical protein
LAAGPSADLEDLDNLVAPAGRSRWANLSDEEDEANLQPAAVRATAMLFYLARQLKIDTQSCEHSVKGAHKGLHHDTSTVIQQAADLRSYLISSH